MARSLWFLAGAGTTAYAVHRARRLREATSVDGLRDRVAALGLGARIFREEVEHGRVEKEAELRERLGLASRGVPELVPPPKNRETRS